MADGSFDTNAFMREAFPGKKEGRNIDAGDLDMFIRQAFPPKYQRKMARVIGDVCRLSGDYFSSDEVADRLYFHVQNGKYAGYGDLKRWGYSEIGPLSVGA